MHGELSGFRDVLNGGAGGLGGTLARYGLQQSINKVMKSDADPTSPEFRDAADDVAMKTRSMIGMVKDPKERAALEKDFNEGGGGRANSLTTGFREALGIKGLDYSKMSNTMTRALGAAGDAAKNLADNNYGKMVVAQMAGRQDAGTYIRELEGAQDYVRGWGFAYTHPDLELASRIGRNQKAGDAQTLGAAGGKGATAMLQQGVKEEMLNAGPGSGISSLLKVANINYEAVMNFAGFDTTLTKEAKLHPGSTGQLSPKTHAATVQSRTIGFGEQESAMASINKSLQRTHDMIKSLQENMNKGKSGPAGGIPTGKPGGP
jgi:hypothetical protein